MNIEIFLLDENPGATVVLDSETVSVDEMEGLLEICVNLTGLTEIDIPVMFRSFDLSAMGMRLTRLL